MTKQIQDFMADVELFFASEHDEKELAAERTLLLQRIELYQHERLIHLLVTLAFGVFFLLSLSMFLQIGGIGLALLTILLLALLVPYIKHYYFLENSVQKLYTYYYKIESYM
jgi:hypothetical protein